MTFTESIGYSAAILTTTTSFVPQAWQTFRIQDVSSISLRTYSFFVVASFLWLGYGLLIFASGHSRPCQKTAALALGIRMMKLNSALPTVTSKLSEPSEELFGQAKQAARARQQVVIQVLDGIWASAR